MTTLQSPGPLSYLLFALIYGSMIGSFFLTYQLLGVVGLFLTPFLWWAVAKALLPK